jgi:hypothetical protein
VTSPDANRSGLRYGIANGIASTLVIFMTTPDPSLTHPGRSVKYKNARD